MTSMKLDVTKTEKQLLLGLTRIQQYDADLIDAYKHCHTPKDRAIKKALKIRIKDAGALYTKLMTKENNNDSQAKR